MEKQEEFLHSMYVKTFDLLRPWAKKLTMGCKSMRCRIKFELFLTISRHILDIFILWKTEKFKKRQGIQMRL